MTYDTPTPTPTPSVPALIPTTWTVEPSAHNGSCDGTIVGGYTLPPDTEHVTWQITASMDWSVSLVPVADEGYTLTFPNYETVLAWNATPPEGCPTATPTPTPTPTATLPHPVVTTPPAKAPVVVPQEHTSTAQPVSSVPTLADTGSNAGIVWWGVGIALLVLGLLCLFTLWAKRSVRKGDAIIADANAAYRAAHDNDGTAAIVSDYRARRIAEGHIVTDAACRFHDAGERRNPYSSGICTICRSEVEEAAS